MSETVTENNQGQEQVTSRTDKNLKLLIASSEPTTSPSGNSVKAPATDNDLKHRNLLSGEFWRAIPAFSNIDKDTFYNHKWQAKHSVTQIDTLLEVLQGLVPTDFIKNAHQGFRKAPMSIRVTPYLLSLIDWKNPEKDAIRRQFIPLGTEILADHPMLGFDSLNEQQDSPVPGLTHRYPDKALFLALDTCPIYCRFCTRSYAVGVNTETNNKINLRVNNERWNAVFDYIASRPELEDIVISGGDAYQLKPKQILTIGHSLLKMPNIRRLRFATKGLIAMPQKIITDHEWRDAIVEVVKAGRQAHKEVVIHTHFNHPNEITEITQQAMNLLMEQGVTVRNQSVLQRQVNDDVDTMRTLIKRLSYLNITPYYVYVHDLVKGVEDLRTTVNEAIELDKQIRGTTAGFNTPVFVVDAPGGGGKRIASSYEYYDKKSGISVYRSPAVNDQQLYLYFDPLNKLAKVDAERWLIEEERNQMIQSAVTLAQATINSVPLLK